MASFSKGTSFTDGVTGDVTAAKLHALVDAATPVPGFITDRTAETSIATDDLVLISDTSDSGALNKMTVANFTNIVSTGTGTAADPAIRPTGDTNTGIFFPAADTIALSEGGTEAMRIDSSGNVGIGTNLPRGKFDVSWNGANQAVFNSIVIGRGGSDYGTISYGADYRNATDNTTGVKYLDSDTISQIDTNAGQFIFRNAPAGTAGNTATLTERLRIDSSGNVGIGTSSPGATFNVQSSSTSAILNYSYASSASYASRVGQLEVNRSATSAYQFLYTLSLGSDIEHNLRGDGNAYADGTWNNNGADYAEFFESASGQALTVGATVVLDQNKVREATQDDDTKNIIGVVRPKEPSKASMVVGNTAWNKWANKYLTDEFDRYIMEDHDIVEWEEKITDGDGKTSTKKHSYESHRIPDGLVVPADSTVKTHDENGSKFQHYKLNPAWDKNAEYINRENRPEWNIVGLLGQVKILKGQPVGDRWIKMRDVSATVEEWMIR